MGRVAAVHHHAIEQVVVSARKARTGSELEVLPVGGYEQHAAETAAAQIFYAAAERIQRLRIRFASRDHLEELDLGREEIVRMFEVVDVRLAGDVADDVALRVATGHANATHPSIATVLVSHAERRGGTL